MAKRIITTLLALQLLVTAAVCGGVCCVADFNPAAEKTVAHPVQSKQAEPESQTESGHCPMHASKPERPKPQARQQHPPDSSGQSIAPQRQAKSSTAPVAHLCGCSVEREEREIIARQQRPSEQRPATQASLDAAHFSRWLIETSPPQSASSPSLQSHSPPFNGFQLSLRI
jgi:hypothetical protein